MVLSLFSKVNDFEERKMNSLGLRELKKKYSIGDARTANYDNNSFFFLFFFCYSSS